MQLTIKLFTLISFFLAISKISSAISSVVLITSLLFAFLVFSIYVLHNHCAFLKIFFSSFLASLIMLLPLYISGASILGVAAVPFTVMLRGAVLGSLCGYIYKTFSLKGVAFNAMILIPGTLISYVAYLFAAKISVLFSLDFIKLIFPKCRPLNLYGSFKDYTYKFLFIIIFMVLSSLVDGAFSYLFIKFFNF